MRPFVGIVHISHTFSSFQINNTVSRIGRKKRERPVQALDHGGCLFEHVQLGS